MPAVQGFNWQELKQRLDYSRLLSEKKDNKEGSNIPKGFEKFFKRKGSQDDKKDKKEVAGSAKDEKTDEKEKSDKKEEEEQISDEEDTSKKTKEQKTPEEEGISPKKALNNFFFDPQGGPVFENWIVAALLAGGIYWYLSGSKPS